MLDAGGKVLRVEELDYEVQTRNVLVGAADWLLHPAFVQELQAIVRSGAQAVWTIRWRMVAYGHELKYFRSQSQIERLFVRGRADKDGNAAMVPLSRA